MRTKKYFSFDEERDAEEIIITGFPNNAIDYGKMYVIAKYFKKHFKYNAADLEKELIKFCQTYDKNFNPIAEAEQLKKWVKSATLYNLRKIEEVAISQKDIEFLKKLDTEKDRRILFAVLVLAKALKKAGTRKKKTDYKTSDNYYIHYNNFADIIRLSKLEKIKDTDVAGILNKYSENFLFYNPEKELIRIDFIDKIPEEEIILTDFDDIMFYYKEFFKGIPDILKCVTCGEEFERTGRSQKYCPSCAKEKAKERSRNSMRKVREK